jgi:hypothetical protein
MYGNNGYKNFYYCYQEKNEFNSTYPQSYTQANRLKKHLINRKEAFILSYSETQRIH